MPRLELGPILAVLEWQKTAEALDDGGTYRRSTLQLYVILLGEFLYLGVCYYRCHG